MNPETRAHVHALIDQLPPGQLAAVETLLKSMLDPVSRKMALAPPDDEPFTDQERQAVAEAVEWSRHNEPIPLEHVLGEFGLTLDDWNAMGKTPLPHKDNGGNGYPRQDRVDETRWAATRTLCPSLLRLYQLAGQDEVLAMLKSDEYPAIKADYDRISREHFDRSYFFPEGMRFAASDAFFPPTQIESAIRTAYEAQCGLLCYGLHPSWTEVKERFLDVKELL